MLHALFFSSDLMPLYIDANGDALGVDAVLATSQDGTHKLLKTPKVSAADPPPPPSAALAHLRDSRASRPSRPVSSASARHWFGDILRPFGIVRRAGELTPPASLWLTLNPLHMNGRFCRKPASCTGASPGLRVSHWRMTVLPRCCSSPLPPPSPPQLGTAPSLYAHGLMFMWNTGPLALTSSRCLACRRRRDGRQPLGGDGGAR